MRHVLTIAAFLTFLILPPFSLHALEPEARRKIESLGELLVAAINQPAPALRQPMVAGIFDAQKIREAGEERLLKALASLNQRLAPLRFHHAELVEFGAGDSLLVVLGNQDNGAYDDLRRNLVRLITGER